MNPSHTPATMENVTPGTKLADRISGAPRVATSYPRRISGGYVVDVVSCTPHCPEYRWTECLCNLRFA